MKNMLKKKEKEYQERLARQDEDSINKSFSNPDDCTEEIPSCSAAGQTERYRKYSLQISFSNLQSQLDKNSRRELGNIQNFLCAVDAIATISYRCAISIEKARKAFQVVGWYGIATDTIWH